MDSRHFFQTYLIGTEKSGDLTVHVQVSNTRLLGLVTFILNPTIRFQLNDWYNYLIE